MRGERLKALRTNHGYSREKIAKLLDIGEASIPRYESNAMQPSSDVVARIATLFNVTTDYLLGLTDDPTGFKGEGLSVIESRALAIFRLSSDDDQARMLKVLELMTEHHHGDAGV